MMVRHVAAALVAVFGCGRVGGTVGDGGTPVSLELLVRDIGARACTALGRSDHAATSFDRNSGGSTAPWDMRFSEHGLP